MLFPLRVQHLLEIGTVLDERIRLEIAAAAPNLLESVDLREALVRKAAQEAADKWTRE